MRQIVQFNITKAGSWYTAEGIDIPAVTQAKTLSKLKKNIREVTGFFLESEE
ncbi:MAG: hypothetical protein AAB908_01455 [Patescibacteria group bacterium]